MVNLGESLKVLGMQSTLCYGKSLVICPRKASVKICAATTINLLSIRFRSAAFFTLLAVPLTELSDQRFSASDFFPNHLIEPLVELKSELDKIILLKQWLFTQIAKVKSRDLALHWAIDKIYYQYNRNVINEVKNQLKCSERTFQRKFKHFIGVDAKYFEKTARFQSTIKMLLNKRAKHYDLDIIFNNGYYNQSHFIKEFKFLT